MRSIIIGVLIASVASPAWAAEWSGHTTPASFVTGFEKANAEQSILERIPKGETVYRWTRMLTSRRFVGRGQDPGPRGMLANMQGLMKEACPDGSTTAVVAMTVSGRPAARMRADCPLNSQTGLPETYFIVAFAGSGDLFAEQVAFRRVPSESDVAFATKVLEEVRLCRTGSADQICKASPR